MLPTYVVITPARNEAQFIELTIQSVVAQSVRPLKWVIVSDGSTDGTDEIVKRYAISHPWIELVCIPEHSERNFAGKVHAFNAGYARVRELDYEVIASLDGDISFEEDYFSFLLAKLAEDSSLGLVGTPFKEGSNPTYDYRFASIEHVSGACQVFSASVFRRCWRICSGSSGKRWLHRSYCGHHCPYEGVGNQDIYRQSLPSPSRNGDGPARLVDVAF